MRWKSRYRKSSRNVTGSLSIGIDWTSVNCFAFFRDYSGQLQEYLDQCGTMLTELDKALEFLQEMKRRHQFVSQRTGALHQACEQLVEEEVEKITSLSNAILCVYA